jgi:transcriptional regulator of acetoin/glycerol metabolism
MMSLKEPSFLDNNLEVDSAETAKAWSKFLSHRNAPSLPCMGVRPLIYRSWERSNKTGIRAEQFAAPSHKKIELDEKQIFYQSEMRRATQKCLYNMNDMLSGTEAMLILTDKGGVILETVGDNSTLNKGGKINLDVGGVWSEAASGTNGIGTALWMDKPVFVHGEEHFCEGMKAWSCAAAPIHGPVDQSIIGAINLSGLTSIFQKHNAAFAAALARDIEEALLKSLWSMNFKLLEWVVGRKPHKLLTGSESLTIINRFGQLIFDGSSHESVTSPLEIEKLDKPFIDLSGSLSEEAIIAALPSGVICKDVQLIEINGIANGASLILDDYTVSQRLKKPAKRIPLPGVELGNSGLKIVGRSEAILATLESAYSLIDTNIPTLIQGETGVGKQLFANLIHAGNVPSKKRPFTTINCAALTRELLESGFKQPKMADMGVSSPASQTDGKSLVFDEIGELPFDLQPVLLRLLENIYAETYKTQAGSFPVRLLSLTNRHLLDEISTGRFRRDLYYRLGAIVLDIPPLRDRGDDILLIFEHYNRLNSVKSGRAPLVLSTDVEEALLAHDWPGNVRELCNAVASLHYKTNARNVAISDLPFNQEPVCSPIQAEHPVPREIGSSSLKASEFAAVESALIAHNCNLSKTAIALGISRPTLYRKMELYNIYIEDGNVRQM